MKSIILTVNDPKTGKPVEMDVRKIIEGSMYIFVKEGGKIIPFKFNPPQERLWESICDDWNNNVPIRYVILKARQMGFSTLIEAFLFVLTTFQPYMKSIIVADIEENATSLFDMSKNFYDSFRWANVLPKKKKANGKILSFEGDSSIRILCASKNTGRSKSCQYLHLSEFAFWDDPETAMTALSQTVSSNNPHSAIFIESTANGFNEFKVRCDKARAKEGNYKFFFFPWFEMPSYRRPYTGFVKTQEEKDIQERFNLDDDQLEWRRYTIKNECNNNILTFHQEYPATPEEAFISTGDSVFNNEVVAEQKAIAEKRVHRRGRFTYDLERGAGVEEVLVKNIHWEDDNENGEIRIYSEPIKGFPYVLAGDPADGGRDYWAGTVINNLNKQQVATYHALGVKAKDYALQLYCLGLYFNTALIGTEVNKRKDIMEKLADNFNYPNLYQREQKDSIERGIENKWGSYTDVATKPAIVDEFMEVFEHNPSLIVDFTTLSEMETFGWVTTPSGKKTAKAVSDKYHDDTVMSYAIALGISDQQDAYVSPEERKEEKRVSDWVNESIANDIAFNKGGLFGL